MKRSVIDLKPTQFALGMKEVEKKAHKLKHMSSKELDDYLDEHRIPVVVAPNKDLYLIDHHHLARACWEAGIHKVKVEERNDLSNLSDKNFWKALVDSHWAHLFDQFGNGPHPPEQLPEDIRCLADDPYRSLAWLVREEGGFEKSHTPFAEFHWASFFRKKLKIDRGDHGVHAALKSALALCFSHEVSHLPGAKRGSKG